MNILLNIPIMFMALRYMGKFYLIITIYGTVMLSFFIDSLSFLSTLSVIKDPVLSAISGGVLMGLGCGILYRYNGNGGGMDVVAAIMKKYYNLEMGNVLFAMNCMIVAAGAVIFTLELAVCTLIGMYIATNVINRVVIGWDQRKAAFIVSEKPMEISDSIIRHIGHGATLLYGQGAFTGKEKEILFTIINLTQIARMKQLIRTIDPNAFSVYYEYHRRHRPRIYPSHTGRRLSACDPPLYQGHGRKNYAHRRVGNPNESRKIPRSHGLAPF